MEMSDWVVSGGKYSLDFATNDYVSIPVQSASPLLGATQATMSCWMYRNSGTQQQIGMEASASSRFFLTHFTDNKIYLSAQNGVNSFPNVSASITGWNHYAFVYDGSQAGVARVAIFINGVSQAITAGGVDPSASLPSSFTSVSIGRDVASARFSTGGFDDIVLYSRTLLVNEIRLLATRRGIAYETVQRRSRKSAAAAGNRRRRVLLTGTN